MTTKCIQAYTHSQNASFASTVRDRYEVSHSAPHFFTFLADTKERNMIINLVLRSQEPNMPKFLIQFLTFALPSVLVLKV